MKIQGIEIDADQIAAGLIRITDEIGQGYPEALRLGMLPAPLMASLERMIGEKYDEIAAGGEKDLTDLWDSLGMPEESAAVRRAFAESRKTFTEKAVRVISLAMYGQARLVV